MEYTELDPRALDATTAEEIAGVKLAAGRPTPTTGPSVQLRKRHGWGEDRPDWITVAREDGRIVAVGTLMFPRRANRHLAYLWIDVRPEHRRHGIGSTLLTAPRTARSPTGGTA